MPGATLKRPSFKIYSLSEHAVTIEFGSEINEEIFEQVSNFTALVKKQPFLGFITAVPAYTTLSVFFDPVKVFLSHELEGRDNFEKVCNHLKKLDQQTISQPKVAVNTVTIPVCYGGTFGPDLESVARHHQITIEEVVHVHSSTTYKVYMLGFMPGFAYLGGLPTQLHMPRKTKPRIAVPAGSVALAGAQTGVYPFETPGG